jgi:hypothetical protein
MTLATWQAESTAELSALDAELQAAMARLRALRDRAAGVAQRITAGAERLTDEIYDRTEDPAGADEQLLHQLGALPSIDADEVGGALDALGDLRRYRPGDLRLPG